eukprot:3916625-Amphidinium_carterae.1
MSDEEWDSLVNQKPLLVLYTAAAWDSHLQRIGAVLTYQGKPIAAKWCDVPQSFVDSLKPRHTQITPCEAAAVVVATQWFSALLTQRDLIVLVDNTAAASAMATGSSKTWDLAVLSLQWHHLLAIHNIRAWIEYVPSDENLADEPRRAGTFASKGASSATWPSWVR